MNNDTNNSSNNLNGTVLGSVNNNIHPTAPMPTNNIETLDIDTPNTSNTLYNNQELYNNQNVNSITQNTNTIDNQGMNSQIVTNPGVIESQAQMPNNVSETNTYLSNPDLNSNTLGALNNATEVQQPVANEMPQVNKEPLPAYTNPQFINPNPMPGFESPNTIGMTPPISLEPEKKPKKKSNKIIFIILILLALAGVGFGTYYILNYTDLLKKKEEVLVTANELQFYVGATLSTNINDYATITGTDTKNCTLNTEKINVNVEGTYEFTVTCGNISKTGIANVVDNNELTVETKPVYKVVGEKIEAKEFIKEIDDELKYEFVKPEEVESLLKGTPATYMVKIKVTNKNNKILEVDGKLVIMEHAIKGYLTCSSKEQNVENTSAVMTVAEKFVIVNDGKNGYGNVAYEVHNFKFTDETEYTNYLATYKTEKTVTINNVTGDTEFDDDNLTITITNEKDNDLVISEYGESNMEKYSTIRQYFTNTLGYSCVYRTVE